MRVDVAVETFPLFRPEKQVVPHGLVVAGVREGGKRGVGVESGGPDFV